MKSYYKILQLLIFICSIFAFHANGQQVGTIIAFPDNEINSKYDLPIVYYDDILYKADKHKPEIENLGIKRISIKTIISNENFKELEANTDTIYEITDFDISGNIICVFRSSELTEELFCFYDEKNRIVLTCLNNSKEKCDTSHYYVYNEKDLLVEQGEYLFNCCGEVPERSNYKYYYNQSGQLVQTDEFDFISKNKRYKKTYSEICNYDFLGRRSSIKKQYVNNKNDNQASVFRYDSINRIVFDSCAEETYYYKYNPNGLLSETIVLTKALYTPIITQKFIYNENNELIEGISLSDSVTIKTSTQYNKNKKVKWTYILNESSNKSTSEYEYFYNDKGLMIEISGMQISNGWTTTKNYSKTTIEYEFY